MYKTTLEKQEKNDIYMYKNEIKMQIYFLHYKHTDTPIKQVGDKERESNGHALTASVWCVSTAPSKARQRSLLVVAEWSGACA